MDSLILDLLALVTFILFIVAAIIIGRNIKKTKSTPNIPPGPWKLPIIGSIHHLVTSNPHQKLRDLANTYGPLMHLQLGEVLTIVISSPEYAREVMKTHDLVFASRPKILAMEIMSYDSTNIVFAPYGNYWRQLRKICTLELFTTKRVKSFQPIREGELTNLVTRIASVKGSTVNLTEEVLSSIYTINSRAAFGMKCKDQEKYISVIKEGMTVAAGFDLGDLFPSSNWLQLISGLRPKLEKINELKYLKSVVKETLRLHPPAPLLLPRECREACEINGYHIPLTTKEVILNTFHLVLEEEYAQAAH